MRVTLQGCVLSTMRAMDPEALPFVLRDPSSEAPRTKRERLADWPVAPSHMPRARRRPCEPR
jgi:hypothetical protein